MRTSLQICAQVQTSHALVVSATSGTPCAAIPEVCNSRWAEPDENVAHNLKRCSMQSTSGLAISNRIWSSKAEAESASGLEGLRLSRRGSQHPRAAKLALTIIEHKLAPFRLAVQHVEQLTLIALQSLKLIR